MDKVLQLLRLLTEPTLENFRRVLDIFIVAFLVYQFLRLIRGTQAWRVLAGILFFFIVMGISSALQLTTLHWLLEKGTLLGPVALVILFLPQLRQAIEKVPNLFPAIAASTPTTIRTIEEIVQACAEFARDRTGALIVIERSAPLDTVVESGVLLAANVSGPLLSSIFFSKNSLHDGAAVVRGDRIVAAACQLPLAEGSRIDRQVHMRHRAAMGVTEAFDCLAIVVSEERGTISLAMNGQLQRLESPAQLRTTLLEILREPEKPSKVRLSIVTPSRKQKSKPPHEEKREAMRP